MHANFMQRQALHIVLALADVVGDEGDMAIFDVGENWGTVGGSLDGASLVFCLFHR